MSWLKARVNMAKAVPLTLTSKGLKITAKRPAANPPTRMVGNRGNPWDMLQGQGYRIGPGPEKHGVAKAEDPHITQQQIKRDRIKGINGKG